ncbi:MAG: GNAT family N-acetyltransferase [Rhodospirillaceae bacterium]|nr:GNAT family N-acetyltransferase [Rhodospirillaceae bacterium]
MAFAIAAFHPSDQVRMAQARHIRQVVFCDEQGVAAHEEWDGKDDHCEHFLVTEAGVAIGTARVRPYGPGIFKVERVAVLKDKRGTGAGRLIMREIMARLREHTVVLNAQTAVEAFYNRLGFVSEGEVFVEAGIPHIHMIWRP